MDRSLDTVRGVVPEPAPATRSPERRGRPRVPFCWPLSVVTPDGATHRSSTANVAAGGVLFHLPAAEAPDLGASLRLLFHVPAAAQDQKAWFHFRAEGTGRVVRTERAGTPEIPMRGVAVAFDRPLDLVETFAGLP